MVKMNGSKIVFLALWREGVKFARMEGLIIINSPNDKILQQPQIAFFPIIKVSLQFLIKRIYSITRSTKDSSCLLVGETSQGRGSDFERKEALIHPITIK